MSIVVRDMVAEDQAAWEQLFRGYIAFYKAEIPSDMYATTFARLLGEEPGTHRGFMR